MIWDFISATLLQTIDIGKSIHYICAHKEFKDTIFVAASCPEKKGLNGECNRWVQNVLIYYQITTPLYCVSL